MWERLWPLILHTTWPLRHASPSSQPKSRSSLSCRMIFTLASLSLVTTLSCCPELRRQGEEGDGKEGEEEEEGEGEDDKEGEEEGEDDDKEGGGG